MLNHSKLLKKHIPTVIVYSRTLYTSAVNLPYLGVIVHCMALSTYIKFNLDHNANMVEVKDTSCDGTSGYRTYLKHTRMHTLTHAYIHRHTHRYAHKTYPQKKHNHTHTLTHPHPHTHTPTHTFSTAAWQELVAQLLAEGSSLIRRTSCSCCCLN